MNQEFISLNLTFIHDTTDKDECATNTDGCQNICKNNVGSYTCKCNDGYNLNSDKMTCSGLDKYNNNYAQISLPIRYCVNK